MSGQGAFIVFFVVLGMVSAIGAYYGRRALQRALVRRMARYAPLEAKPDDRLIELRSWLDTGVITKDEYKKLCDGVIDGH